MARAIKRKDFLVLTVTFGTFGAVTACGDDDASTSWEGGAGNAGGGATQGGAGSNHAGSADAGGSSASNGGGLPGGGQAGNDAGPGGAPASTGAAGEGGAAGAGHGGSDEESSAGNAGQAAADGGNDAGGGGNSGAGVGNSGEGGLGGAGGAGGATAASSCAGAHMMQTSVNDHTHITPSGEKILTSLLNGSNPTAPFQLPPGAGGHSHTIELTPTEVDALLAGFSVTGKVSSLNGHTHTYTISCG